MEIVERSRFDETDVIADDDRGFGFICHVFCVSSNFDVVESKRKEKHADGISDAVLSGDSNWRYERAIFQLLSSEAECGDESASVAGSKTCNEESCSKRDEN